MPQRIHEDHQMFRRVIDGKLRKELKKFQETGQIFRMRPKGGVIGVPLPKIGLPHFRHGSSGEGVGRGPGKPGDVVGRDKGKKGKGQGGNQGGTDPGEGMIVHVDMGDAVKWLMGELELPPMKPKPSRVFEEVRIRYNGISKVGPRALINRHRTMRQALLRKCADGSFDELVKVPGVLHPIRVITPIKDDFRFRQWNEERIPCSNAVIFFARDGSGSMGEDKTGIVSDLAFWIEEFIKTQYKKVSREYVWHDTIAESVDEATFYGKRYGGGTMCSSAFEHIAEQLKHRYPPDKYNVYVFYFSDGENQQNDNATMCKIMTEDLNENVINLFGMVQVLSWRYQDSVKSAIDDQIKGAKLNPDVYRTTEIAASREGQEGAGNWWRYDQSMPVEQMDLAKKNAIKDLLGKSRKPAMKGVEV